MTPRVPRTLRRGALVRAFHPLRGRPHAVDLRALAGALVGRADVSDWRAVLQPSKRHGADELLVHVAPAAGSDLADVAVSTARDLRTVAGTLPSQVVASSPSELAALDSNGSGAMRLTRRVLVRE
jgi:hypothetical protein